MNATTSPHPSRLAGRSLVTPTDLSGDEIGEILRLARTFKRSPSVPQYLKGVAVGLLFEQPSTRTRVSFDVGVAQLGGHPVVLSGSELQLSRGESPEDTARVLSRYLGGIVARTVRQETLERLAGAAGVPVINALTDRFHPCQVLADLMTVEEAFGRLEGITLAYVGDGNNMTHTWLEMGPAVGMRVVVSTPPGYGPDPEVAAAARAAHPDRVDFVEDPRAAVRGAHVVYTDTFFSMAQAPDPDKARVLAPYRVTRELMAHAEPGARFMHCLPAHRGEEVDADVIDSAASLVFEEAENRLHAQKAVLAALVGNWR